MHFQGVLCTVTFATLASAAVAKQIPNPGWDKYADEREEANIAAREAADDPEALTAWEEAHGGTAPVYDYDEAATPLATHAANWASQLSSFAANAVPSLEARDAEASPPPHTAHPTHTGHHGGHWTNPSAWASWIAGHPQATAHHGIKQGIKHAARAVADAVGMDTETDEIDEMNAKWQREFDEEHGLNERDVESDAQNDPTLQPTYEGLEARNAMPELELWDDGTEDATLSARDAEPELAPWTDSVEGADIHARDAEAEVFDWDSVMGDAEVYARDAPLEPWDEELERRDVGDETLQPWDEEEDLERRDADDDELYDYDSGVYARDAEAEEFDWSTVGGGEVEARDVEDEGIQPYGDDIERRDVDDDEDEGGLEQFAEGTVEERDARNVFMPDMGMGAHPGRFAKMAERDVEGEGLQPWDEEEEGNDLQARDPLSLKSHNHFTVPAQPKPTGKSKWFPW